MTDTLDVPRMPYEGQGITEDQAIAELMAMEDDEDEPQDDASASHDATVPHAEDDSSDDDSDAAEDEDGETDDDGDTDDEDGEGEPTYKVKLQDGTEAEVTLAELQTGYIARRDYDRRVMELSQERTVVHEAYEEIKQGEELLASKLEQFALAFGRSLSPDQMAQLESEYVTLKRGMEQRETQKRYDQLREQKGLLLDLIPEWKDSNLAASEKRAIATWAESIGLTSEDLANVVDARAMRVLRSAYKYEEIASRGREVVDSKRVVGKVLQPGTSTASHSRGDGALQKEIKAAQRRFSQTGSINDGARVLELQEELDERRARRRRD